MKECHRLRLGPFAGWSGTVGNFAHRDQKAVAHKNIDTRHRKRRRRSPPQLPKTNPISSEHFILGDDFGRDLPRMPTAQQLTAIDRVFCFGSTALGVPL
jgi:hypothetical protein